MLQCRVFRLRVPYAPGSSLCRLSPVVPKQSNQRPTPEHRNFFTGYASCYVGTLWSRGSTTVPRACETCGRTAGHTEGWPLIGGFGSPVSSVHLIRPAGIWHQLHPRITASQLALGTPFLLYGHFRAWHSIAANLQRNSGIGEDGSPQNASLSSTTPAIAMDPDEFSAASALMDNINPAEPAEGSYARELLQHIHDVVSSRFASQMANDAGPHSVSEPVWVSTRIFCGIADRACSWCGSRCWSCDLI